MLCTDSCFSKGLTQQEVDKLTILSEKKVTVVRDGRECEISRDEIVQDDVVVLSRGCLLYTSN